MEQNIFNLIENPNDLPSSNENMADLYYREILPTRNVTDTASDSKYSSQFGGTNISIRWNHDNRTWWIPSRSYLKMDIEITKPGDGSEPLTLADQIAPNMGLAPSLFNKLQMKMNDTTISQISQYIPQCDSIAKRVYNSGYWLDKTNGNSSNFWEAYQKKRMHDISSDGLVSDYFIPKVSSNEEVLNLDASDRFAILNKSQLGLGEVINGNAGVTSALDITQNQVATITGLNGFVVPNLQNTDILQKGDIIVLILRTAVPATEAFRRVFVVLDITGAATFTVSSLSGLDLGAAIGNNGDGGYAILRYRHQIPIVELPKTEVFQTSAATSAVTAASNLFTIAAGVIQLEKLNQLDIVHRNLAANAGRQVSFLNVQTQADTDLNFNAATSDILAANINAADVNLRTFKYSDVYEFTAGPLSLGYTNVPTQNNSHAFTIAAAANGMLFTQFQNGGAVLPNVNDIWKEGDWLIFHAQANDHHSWFWVEQVDPDGTGNTLLLQSSQLINANIGANNDGRNFVVGRARYNPLAPDLFDSINISKNKSKFDICWKPSCLSIFNYPGAIPGGCKFELELQALALDYTGIGIETPFGVQKISRTTSSIVGVDFQLLVKNVKFYACQAQGPVVGNEEYSYYINMNEIRAHTRKIQSKSLVQTSLDVTPSSYALALAFQDDRAINRGDTDKSITKFHVHGSNTDREELSLIRYSIRFAGLSLPQPDSEIKEGSIQDFINNQYMRNQIYTNQYYKTTGGESLIEWKERGIYFYHPFIRSAGNREVRAYVITQFNENDLELNQLSDIGLENLKLFLFEFYRAFALIKMKSGKVYSIQTANQ